MLDGGGGGRSARRGSANESRRGLDEREGFGGCAEGERPMERGRRFGQCERETRMEVAKTATRLIVIGAGRVVVMVEIGCRRAAHVGEGAGLLRRVKEETEHRGERVDAEQARVRSTLERPRALALALQVRPPGSRV